MRDYTKGWTDYPIQDLGDLPYKKAPIRQVKVHGWDGNKYACVTVEGMKYAVSIKWFYIYSARGHYGKVPEFSLMNLRKLSFEDELNLCAHPQNGFPKVTPYPKPKKRQRP